MAKGWRRQEDFAPVLGMSQPTLSRLESGKRLANPEEREKLRQLLGGRASDYGSNGHK